MEFQNTIAYLQTYNAGGVVVPTTSFASIGFASTGVDGLIKNIKTTAKQSITSQQDGTYFVDFSLVAIGGDNKTYTIAPFINDVDVTNPATKVEFYQQNTNQQYEVSFNQTFSLNSGDTLEFKIKVDSVPSTTFSLKDIKIMAYNLNQLGIH